MALAGETGLRPGVVEKDYVLGWLLAAINANAALAPSWVFKGGTCLKKCYFETYRFSEDLDFTLTDEAHLDESFLIEQFRWIADWLYEACGIEIPVDRLKFDIYENPRGHKSCEGKVYYQSHFSSGKKNIPKIKFDLTAHEVLVLPPSRQPVIHPYTDEPDGGIYIDCYDYPEVFGEKIRALGERCRPRDLYDVINLYRNDQLPSAAIIQDVLRQKCDFKGIGLPTCEGLGAYEESLRQNWEPMLAHQLPALPALEAYWDALPDFFAWLLGEQAPVTAQLGAVTGSGEPYRPAYGQLGLRTLSGSSLEIIRFAAGNRLCVSLDYTDNSGSRSSRIIEPYSLRQAQNGNILLYAVRAEDGQIRAYKIDQINDAFVTNIVFVPRHQIELSPGVTAAQVRQTTGSATRLGIPARSQRNASPSRGRNTLRSTVGSNRPTYIYSCPICEKKFRRKKQGSRLNPHKSKDGGVCSARTGIYEDTVY